MAQRGRPLLHDVVSEKVRLHFEATRSDGDNSVQPRQVRQASVGSRLSHGGDVDHGTRFPPCIFVPSWTKVVAFLCGCAVLALCCTVWKQPLERHGLTTEVLLRYLSLPVVSVAFTYAHIWAALWMTFYPLEFWGVPGTQIPENPLGLGWQGIVPSKGRKMSVTLIRNILGKLLTVEEIFAGIDPDCLMSEMREPLAPALQQAIDTLGAEEAPAVWALMPAAVKDELVLYVLEEAPKLMCDLFRQLQSDVNSVFDIEDMVVKGMQKDKSLIVHMFLSCGYPELEFIRDTGAYMGLFFGIVQMVQQYLYPVGWTLPIFSTIVGFLTNWLALKMIFEPVEPRPLLGGRVVLQGVFLRRQHEVAPLYAKIFAEKVACAQLLIPAMFRGPRSDKLIAMIVDHVDAAIERRAGALRPLAGRPSYKRAKEVIAQKIIATFPEAFLAADQYLDGAMRVEATLTERVLKMTSADFEQLLHPVFQEDEWILILLGGVLGLIVGMTQWHALGLS